MTIGALGAVGWHIREIRGFVYERLKAKVASYRYPHTDYAQAIIRHFHYLDLDQADLNQFVRDYARVWGEKTWRTPLDHLFEIFLMSSDFFQNGADETRTVSYVALYAPWVSVCQNPLAEFD